MDRAQLKMFGHQLAGMQNQLSAMMTVIEAELQKPDPGAPAIAPAPNGTDNGPRAPKERVHFGEKLPALTPHQ